MSSLLNTTSIVSLPSNDFARKQAEVAFKEKRDGEKIIGHAQQRLVYAIRIHDANLRNGKANLPALVAFLEKDAKGKATADSDTVRDHYVGAFAGDTKPSDKPDFEKMDAEAKMKATNDFNARVALVKFSLKIAAYCEKYGTVWSDFNTATNNLLVKAEMLYPAGAKPSGRCAPDIKDGVVIPAGLIELNGRSVTYVENVKGSDQDRRKPALVAQLLRCVASGKPKAKRAVGGAPDPKADKPCDPMKAADLARDSQVTVLMNAIHTLLCGKDKPSAPPTIRDYNAKFWKHAMDVMMLLDTACANPDFQTPRDGKDVPKDVAAYFATRAKAMAA